MSFMDAGDALERIERVREDEFDRDRQRRLEEIARIAREETERREAERRMVEHHYGSIYALDEGGYVAYCVCGWEGDPRTASKDAKRTLTAHIAWVAS